MIKKTLLALLFAFALFPFMRNARADVVTPANYVDYSELWTIKAVGDTYAAELEFSFEQGSLSTLDITIPSNNILAQDYEGQSSHFMVMGGAGTIVYADLDDYVADLTTGDVIEFDFEYPAIHTDGINNTDSDIRTTNYIFIKAIIATTTEPPDDLIYYIQSRAHVVGLSWGLPVLFYNRLDLYDYQTYGPLFEAPADPTPPTNYDFAGWKTIAGSLFNFESPVITDDILSITEEDGSHLKLFAAFVYVPSSETETPTLTPETVPTWLSGPLGMIGLDNDPGYFLVFAFVAVLLVVGLLLVNAPLKGFIMIGLLLWTGISIWLGILPLWGAAILIAMELGFIIKAFSNPGGDVA